MPQQKPDAYPGQPESNNPHALLDAMRSYPGLDVSPSIEPGTWHSFSGHPLAKPRRGPGKGRQILIGVGSTGEENIAAVEIDRPDRDPFVIITRIPRSDELQVAEVLGIVQVGEPFVVGRKTGWSDKMSSRQLSFGFLPEGKLGISDLGSKNGTNKIEAVKPIEEATVQEDPGKVSVKGIKGWLSRVRPPAQSAAADKNKENPLEKVPWDGPQEGISLVYNLARNETGVRPSSPRQAILEPDPSENQTRVMPKPQPDPSENQTRVMPKPPREGVDSGRKRIRIIPQPPSESLRSKLEGESKRKRGKHIGNFDEI